MATITYRQTITMTFEPAMAPQFIPADIRHAEQGQDDYCTVITQTS